MTLDDRVERLEKQSRRYMILFVAAALTALALTAYVVTRPQPDKLQAKSFEVVNREGNVVAILGLTDRHGFLDISTGDGVPIFNIIAHPRISDVGIFSLRNVRGREIMNVRADSRGAGVLSVRDPRGLERVILFGANPTATGGTVQVMSGGSRPSVVASMQADGYGHGEVQACPRNGLKCRKLIPSQ